MSRKKIVFFLGSGFAKSLANIPIQNSFLKDIFNYELLGKRGRKLILDPLKGDEVGKRMADNIGDIEQLLSYIYHADCYDRETQGENGQKEYKKAIINFRILMNEFLNSYPLAKDENINGINNFNKLISELNSEDITFLTTNYDLVLEKNLDQKAQPDILKLHGSIDWLEKRDITQKGELIGSGEEIHSEYLNRNKILLKKLKPCFYGKTGICYQNEHSADYYSPITIPFFLQKFDWMNLRWKSVFKPIYEKAEEALSSASVIVFIGYGFPKADYNMLSLFRKIQKETNIINISRDNTALLNIGLNTTKCTGKFLQEMKEEEISELYKSF